MQLTFASPINEPFDSMQDMHAVVACSDSTAGRHAQSVLEGVSRRCGGPGRLTYSLWNFDLLTVSVLRKQAASEAAAADIIVIAAHGEADFSETIKDWISLWLSQKEDRPRALACVVDRGTTAGAHRMVSQLRRVAELGGLDFFANGDDKEMSAALSRRGSAASPGNLF